MLIMPAMNEVQRRDLQRTTSSRREHEKYGPLARETPKASSRGVEPKELQRARRVIERDWEPERWRRRGEIG